MMTNTYINSLSSLVKILYFSFLTGLLGSGLFILGGLIYNPWNSHGAWLFSNFDLPFLGILLGWFSTSPFLLFYGFLVFFPLALALSLAYPVLLRFGFLGLEERIISLKSFWPVLTVVAQSIGIGALSGILLFGLYVVNIFNELTNILIGWFFTLILSTIAMVFCSDCGSGNMAAASIFWVFSIGFWGGLGFSMFYKLRKLQERLKATQ